MGVFSLLVLLGSFAPLTISYGDMINSSSGGSSGGCYGDDCESSHRATKYDCCFWHPSHQTYLLIQIAVIFLTAGTILVLVILACIYDPTIKKTGIKAMTS